MNAHYRLNIRIIDEGLKCRNEISLEYLCSEYMLKHECESACGFGTKDGSCHWKPENRYISISVYFLNYSIKINLKVLSI